MIINSIASPEKSYSSPSFTARPEQIFNKAVLAGCPGKRAYLTNLAIYFDKLEHKMRNNISLPDSFDYFLKEDNYIPKKLAKTKVRTGFLSWTSFKSLDKHLRETEFACSSESHCSCGKGKSLKEYTSDLLEKIGVPEPDKISLRIYR